MSYILLAELGQISQHSTAARQSLGYQRSQPRWEDRRYFTLGCCCLLRRRYQRSPTELLFTLSGFSLLEWDKHTVNWSVGNSTQLEGSQAGKKHVACKKLHVTAPQSEELAGMQCQPFHAVIPPSRQPGVPLPVLDPTHTHGHHCVSMPWSPLCGWQAVFPPGKSHGQPSWEVTGH